MNADGGEALRRCLPADLFELYAQTSRRTYDRRESVVLDDQLNELSSQPHLGPPNEGERPHTGVHRRTLRAILRARLGGSFHPGQGRHRVSGDTGQGNGDARRRRYGRGRRPGRRRRHPLGGPRAEAPRHHGHRHRRPRPRRFRPHAADLRTGPAAAAAPVRGRDHRRGPQGLAAAHRGLPAPAAPAGRGGRDRAGRDARAGRGLRHDQLQRGARDGDPARGAVDGRHAGHAPRRHAGRDRGLASRPPALSSRTSTLPRSS